MSTLVDRFLKYVKIDTQSQEGVSDKYPSTENQLDFAKLLVDELLEFKLTNVDMDEYGYVTATLPSNLKSETALQVPVIGLLAHMDTSPEVSGKDVKPLIHKSYNGGVINYPDAPGLILSPQDNPDLNNCIGNDIITSDGTTLLGADNKAGIAEIMSMIERLCSNPDIPHGEIRIGFTPDEEVGNGTKFFNISKFGADYAYTVDGGRLGEIENENFNAVSAIINIEGVGVHPGYAKGKLVNAMRIGAEILTRLAEVPAPETTEGREGFIHPYIISGGAVHSELKMLLRDFEKSGIEQKMALIESIVSDLSLHHPYAQIDLIFSDSYQNMRSKLKEKPYVVEFALEAVRRAGLKPALKIIRGGTDGAKLSQKGLLTPNIFTGGHNFHSKTEWISIQSMEKTVETLIQLVQLWSEWQ